MDVFTSTGHLHFGNLVKERGKGKWVPLRSHLTVYEDGLGGFFFSYFSLLT